MYKISENKMNIRKTYLITALMTISQFSFAAQASDQKVSQLIQVMDINSLLQETLKQLRPQIDQQAYIVIKTYLQHDKLSPQEQIVANELADKMYQQSQNMLSWDQMKPIYQKVYQEVYNAEEIQAQIDFFSSSTGQSILKKSPLVAQESMKIVNSRLVNILKTSEQDFKQLNKKLENLKQAATQK